MGSGDPCEAKVILSASRLCGRIILPPELQTSGILKAAAGGVFCEPLLKVSAT